MSIRNLIFNFGTCLAVGIGSYFFVSSLLLLNFNFSQVVSANVRDNMENSLVQTINRNADLNLNRLDFSDLEFEKDEDINLYLILYSEFVNRSKENGIEIVANTYGYTTSQIRGLVDSYDISFLQSNNAATTSSVNDRAKKMYDSFVQERSLFANLAVLEAQTLAFELFANGTKSDANFDLVVDLNDIEEIILGRNLNSQFSNEFNSQNSGAEALAGSNFSLQNNNQSNTPNEDSNSNSDSENLTQQENPTQNPGDSENLACPIDPNLLTDLNTFETNEQVFSSYFDTYDILNPKNPNAPKINQIIVGSMPNLKSLEDTITKCDLSSDFTGLRFCVRVEEVFANARSYFPQDKDCVACRIQAITNLTEDLTSQSLIPNKVTGNFGEPSLCKKSLFNAFSLQVSFVPKPARPDLQIVDQITQISTPQIAQNIQSLNLDINAEDAFSAARNTVSQSILGATQAQSLPNEILQEEVSIINLERSSNQSIQSTSLFVTELLNRLQTLNLYFANYKNYLSEIQSNLTELTSKPQCSAL